MRRNLHSSGQYRPFHAHATAASRRRRTRPLKLTSDPVLRSFVVARLKERWSPQQISRALQRAHPQEPARRVATETIYQAIYRPATGIVRKPAPSPLRTGRDHRRGHTRQIRAGRRFAQPMLSVWDQGTEMAKHLDVTADTGTRIYFCDAASPWQRGSNENANGLQRQYFPKSTDLSVHSPRDLARVELELNRRPRITLGDRTPHELFNALLASENHARCDDRWNTRRRHGLLFKRRRQDAVLGAERRHRAARRVIRPLRDRQTGHGDRQAHFGSYTHQSDRSVTTEKPRNRHRCPDPELSPKFWEMTPRGASREP
ncbi:IS30 family transposase [Agromyces larvae]|uniref:IS30 family transposase n=1 Tax=Agromyces larvae TaxID=2929802 RepID=A0ABY4BZ82_9MICO|nr:IS30 family transposase [Agromyces larvae]UOE44497.1 IS30 family transposase [Agromyces larvae]